MSRRLRLWVLSLAVAEGVLLPSSPAIRPSRLPRCDPLRLSLQPEDNDDDGSRGDSEKEPSPGELQPDLKVDLSATQEDFEAGLAFGQDIKSRFTSPVIDDPGLPYADSLVVISGTLGLSVLILSGTLPVPFPGWLTPLPGMQGWRGVPYIVPALGHGSGLAFCWLLGALAARAFEADAYCGSLTQAIGRTWRAGAFAIGVLLFSTQLTTFVSMTSAGLDPYLGSSPEGDMRLAGIADEVIFDCLMQATVLTAFRIYRWWDAREFRR